MGTHTPGLDEATRYYRAALTCLGFVEARRPTKRRFGPDADARWKAFRGHLTASDRIDLLLRDANAEWPGAFGARDVFALGDVAEDEAFGARWSSLDGVRGEELWREVSSAPHVQSPREALGTVARSWGLSLRTLPIEPIDAADRIVMAGPSAIFSLVQLFLDRADLDWAVQVTCIATPPAHRHIALAARAVVDSHKPGRVLTPDQAERWPPSARIITSDDAAPEDLTAAKGR